MFLGILAYVLVIPSLESLTSYICQWLEVKRSKLIVQQMKYKKEISDLEEDDTPQYNTHVIGFQVPSSSDYEDDEEEDDEDE